jgi:hypothetical protein
MLKRSAGLAFLVEIGDGAVNAVVEFSISAERAVCEVVALGAHRAEDCAVIEVSVASLAERSRQSCNSRRSSRPAPHLTFPSMRSAIRDGRFSVSGSAATVRFISLRDRARTIESDGSLIVVQQISFLPDGCHFLPVVSMRERTGALKRLVRLGPLPAACAEHWSQSRSASRRNHPIFSTVS